MLSDEISDESAPDAMAGVEHIAINMPNKETSTLCRLLLLRDLLSLGEIMSNILCFDARFYAWRAVAVLSKYDRKKTLIHFSASISFVAAIDRTHIFCMKAAV